MLPNFPPGSDTETPGVGWGLDTRLPLHILSRPGPSPASLGSPAVLEMVLTCAVSVELTERVVHMALTTWVHHSLWPWDKGKEALGGQWERWQGAGVSLPQLWSEGDGLLSHETPLLPMGG